jgi:predicted branched-subunit amino acid permease
MRASKRNQTKSLMPLWCGYAGWTFLAGALGQQPIGLTIGYACKEAVVGKNGVDVGWIFPPFVLI